MKQSAFLNAVDTVELPHGLTLHEYLQLEGIARQKNLDYQGTVSIGSVETHGMNGLLELLHDCRAKLLGAFSQNEFPVPTTNDLSFLINTLPHQDPERHFSIKDGETDHTRKFGELETLYLLGLSVTAAAANTLKERSSSFSTWSNDNTLATLKKGTRLIPAPESTRDIPLWIAYHEKDSSNAPGQNARIAIENARFLNGDSVLAQKTDLHQTYSTAAMLYRSISIHEQDGERVEQALDQMPIHGSLRSFARQEKTGLKLIEELHNWWKNGFFELKGIGDKKFILDKTEEKVDKAYGK